MRTLKISNNDIINVFLRSCFGDKLKRNAKNTSSSRSLFNRDKNGLRVARMKTLSLIVGTLIKTSLHQQLRPFVYHNSSSALSIRTVCCLMMYRFRTSEETVESKTVKFSLKKGSSQFMSGEILPFLKFSN